MQTDFSWNQADDCIKLEGGADMAPVIKAIVKAGIPVCAHIRVLHLSQLL